MSEEKPAGEGINLEQLVDAIEKAVGKEKRRREGDEEEGGKKKAKRPPAAKVPVEDLDDDEKLAICTCVPKNFAEPAEKPYASEEGDKLVPQGGFLQDLVACTRGQESPTIFWIWSGLWTIATLMHREAYFKWLPDEPLWPNLYVVLVAPPGICRKGPPIKKAIKMLKKVVDLMPSRELAFRKETSFVTSKTTPEYLSEKLAPQESSFTKREGTKVRMYSVKKGSQAAIAATELVTFLGKQQYNTGLIEKLTKFYDSDDDDAEGTIARGDTPLEDIYVTMLGAATPDGLKMSIPPEAFGGGFMSRTTLVFQDHRTRSFPLPVVFEGYPSTDFLVRALAWIAYNARGEYALTEAGARWYSDWYSAFWKKAEDEKGLLAEEHRLDIILLKVAMLIRVQEYRKGFDIDVPHLETASRILRYTYSAGRRGIENVNGAPWLETLNFVRAYIAAKGEVTRKTLLQRVSSRGFTADQLNTVLDYLAQEGAIDILLNHSIREQASKSALEVYRYVGAKETQID